MFFSEPPPSPWDVHFRVLGIPVRIHPWFWVAAIVLVGQGLMDAKNVQQIALILLPWTAAFLIGILVHELGHAFAMRAYGRTPRITLYGFGGLTSSGYEGLYVSRGFTTLGQILISAAGPAAGFLSAAVVMLVYWFAGGEVDFTLGGRYGLSIGISAIGPPVVWQFVGGLLVISVYWGLVNLLPVYPLDGGQIARELLLKLNPRNGIYQSLVLSVIVAGGLAVIGLVLWRDVFVAMLFGFLAYSSYTALVAYRGRS